MSEKLPADDPKLEKLTSFAAAIKKDTADGVLNNSIELKQMALELESLSPDLKDLATVMISLGNRAAKVDPPGSDLLMTLSKDIRTFMFTGSDYVFDVKSKPDGTISIEPRNGYMRDGIIHSYTTGNKGYPAEIAFASRLSRIKTMDELRAFLANEADSSITLNRTPVDPSLYASSSDDSGPMMMM